MASPRVAVVIGSTRQNRICPGIADWVLRNAQDGSELDYELVDLAVVNLPFLDEPFQPALGRYAHEHTRAWSRIIQSFDAFVFVFPQYNWGYPGVLKNAVDFLYAEWRDKPTAMVTYGTHGGQKAAAGFRVVLDGVHSRPLDTNLELAITRSDTDGAGQLRDLDTTFAPYREQVRLLNTELTASLPLG